VYQKRRQVLGQITSVNIASLVMLHAFCHCLNSPVSYLVKLIL